MNHENIDPGEALDTSETQGNVPEMATKETIPFQRLTPEQRRQKSQDTRAEVISAINGPESGFTERRHDMIISADGVTWQFADKPYWLSQKEQLLSDNPDRADQIKDILENGSINGWRVDLNWSKKGYNGSTVERARKTAAKLLAESPQTMETIAEEKIIGWHGTSSLSLRTILTDGMHSQKSIEERDDIVRTNGEPLLWDNASARDFVSLTDDIGVGAGYAGQREHKGMVKIRKESLSKAKGEFKAIERRKLEDAKKIYKATKRFQKDELKSGNLLAREPFPIMIGVSEDIVEDSTEYSDNASAHKVVRVNSDKELREYGVEGSIDKKYIRVVAVPESRMDDTHKMLAKWGATDVKLVSLDPIQRATGRV